MSRDVDKRQSDGTKTRRRKELQKTGSHESSLHREELMTKTPLSGIIAWTITHVLFHPLLFIVAQFSPLPTSYLSACIFPDVPFFSLPPGLSPLLSTFSSVLINAISRIASHLPPGLPRPSVYLPVYPSIPPSLTPPPPHPDGCQGVAACCGQANYLHNYDLPLNHMILYLDVGN